MSEAKYRMLRMIGDWYVGTYDGRDGAVLGILLSRWEYGSPRLERSDRLPSMEILRPGGTG
ncbi:hypothetical protein ACLK1S_02875 [Escherichia coli]